MLDNASGPRRLTPLLRLLLLLVAVAPTTVQGRLRRLAALDRGLVDAAQQQRQHDGPHSRVGQAR